MILRFTYRDRFNLSFVCITNPTIITKISEGKFGFDAKRSLVTNPSLSKSYGYVFARYIGCIYVSSI